MANVLKNLRNVEGLDDSERSALCELLDTYEAHKGGNRKRLRYYLDEVSMERIGVSIPENAPKVDVRVGWAAKAVDMLASRSILDGFTATDDETGEALREIAERCHVSEKYDMALTSQLIYGPSFMTVMADGRNQRRARIQFHSAENGAAVWDKFEERVKHAIVVEDWAVRDKRTVPSVVALHMDSEVVRFALVGNAWSVQRMANRIGRPTVVALRHRPTDARPMGRSRITRKVMALTQQAMREKERLEYHSEHAATGSKYILGAADELFETDKFRMTADSLLLIGKDADGDIPTVGQFDNQSVDGHIKVLEGLAQEMAAESSIPLSSLGVMGSGYTSSDALRAASDDLIVEAEALNKTNGEAIKAAMQMALLIERGGTWESMTEAERDIAVCWRDPAMPSKASAADAAVKIASVMPGYAETDVFMENLGFSEDQRIRIRADRRRAQALSVRDSLIQANQ